MLAGALKKKHAFDYISVYKAKETVINFNFCQHQLRAVLPNLMFAKVTRYTVHIIYSTYTLYSSKYIYTVHVYVYVSHLYMKITKTAYLASTSPLTMRFLNGGLSNRAVETTSRV